MRNKKTGQGIFPDRFFRHDPKSDQVGINDQLDLLTCVHAHTNTLVPLPDISDSHIVILRNPIKRFAAPNAVEDLLLFAGLSH